MQCASFYVEGIDLASKLRKCLSKWRWSRPFSGKMSAHKFSVTDPSNHTISRFYTLWATFFTIKPKNNLFHLIRKCHTFLGVLSPERVEVWHFRASLLDFQDKRILSVCNTLLHLGALVISKLRVSLRSIERWWSKHSYFPANLDINVLPCRINLKQRNPNIPCTSQDVSSLATHAYPE